MVTLLPFLFYIRRAGMQEKMGVSFSGLENENVENPYPGRDYRVWRGVGSR